MDAYTSFARVYDQLMDNIPYSNWGKYIKDLLNNSHVDSGLIAELGCGTGNITEYLANNGYDMIGIDNSQEMLEIANEKKYQHNLSTIMYLLQDMTDFELYGTVSAFVCVCDSINYLLSDKDITCVFKLANNYLEKDGIFICDFKTDYYFSEIINDSTFAEDRGDLSFIWDNCYDRENRINELALSLFIKESTAAKTDDTLYRKYEEFHYQRGLTIEEMKSAIEKSGMKILHIYDAFTQEPATAKSERVYIIAKESHQAGKYYTK